MGASGSGSVESQVKQIGFRLKITDASWNYAMYRKSFVIAVPIWMVLFFNFFIDLTFALSIYAKVRCSPIKQLGDIFIKISLISFQC